MAARSSAPSQATPNMGHRHRDLALGSLDTLRAMGVAGAAASVVRSYRERPRNVATSSSTARAVIRRAPIANRHRGDHREPPGTPVSCADKLWGTS